MLFYTILYYTILYYTILYYTILYYTILYYTIPYHTIPYHTMPCHAMPYYAMPCYSIRYIILHCTILQTLACTTYTRRIPQRLMFTLLSHCCPRECHRGDNCHKRDIGCSDSIVTAVYLTVLRPRQHCESDQQQH